MKINRTYIFIGFSSLALLVLLAIQINWLFQTAKVKEELFNEKATLVLARTTQELSADKETCMSMGSCCMEEGAQECALKLSKTDINKIDSLLKHFMLFYNFHMDYSFEVIQKTLPVGYAAETRWESNVFKKRLEEEVNKNGLELKLIFPEKKKFVLEEMGVSFITSILLILIVFALFIRTIYFLIKEKKLSEHTTEFINNMTHEFKTPLTNIGLASKMLIKEQQLPNLEKTKHYTEIILSENEKLKQQVEQILSITALERGDIPVSLTEVDVHSLVHNALKCMSVQVENRGGEIQQQLKANEFVIYGDKAHLTNVFCNLIDNALKYSKQIPLIKISTENANNALLLSFTDNGPGIEKKYLKQIFKKFFRVPTGNVHDVKGFGLGLAYVKKIIELHHGHIDATSELNKGTTFTITLPLANGREKN